MPFLGTTIDEEIESVELTQVLNAWLKTLKPENLYIFMRRYWYMDSTLQISQGLKFSQAAVYLRIDRMKKSLNRYLSQRGVLK